MTPQQKYFPNDTPVILRDNMIHLYKHGETRCSLRGGWVITLVQAMVFLKKATWCFHCWGLSHPDIKVRLKIQ